MEHKLLDGPSKAWAYVAAIVATLSLTTSLVIVGILNWWALIPIAAICLPPAFTAGIIFRNEYRNQIHYVLRLLDKLEFEIKDMKWSDDGQSAQILGVYNEESFSIDVNAHSQYIRICDLPWSSLKASDSSVPRLLEAINDVNAQTSNVSVCLTEPDEDGDRRLLTLAATVLPKYKAHEYLRWLIIIMLSRKKALIESFNAERPWMAQRRSPIGFNAPGMDAEPTAETSDFAARMKSTPK